MQGRTERGGLKVTAMSAGLRGIRVIDRDLLTAAAGVVVPLAVAGVLAPFRATLPATDAALCVVLVVVAVAAAGKRAGGYLAAVSAAAWFDFFFTTPYNQFAINNRDEIETTILLLAIGVAVTEIAVWGRRQQLDASRRAGYLDGVRAAAQAVAAGDSPAALTERVCQELSTVLGLRSCRFQAGIAGIGEPARLHQDGRVTVPRRSWDADRDGLPQAIDTELLAESGGLLQGRFLMTALPGAHPTLEQRLVAVALADQVAAALAATRRAGHRASQG
jgi:K+-sensing histidine kinase KdpD